MKMAKWRVKNSGLVLMALVALCGAMGQAGATTYYWDNNGSAAGFGTADGTWAAPTTGDSLQGWSTSLTGALVPGSVTTATNDDLVFGTTNAGLAAGIVTVSGGVNFKGLTVGSGSGAITISGGTITNGGGNTLVVNNSASMLTINSDIVLIAGLNSYRTVGGNVTLGGNLTTTAGSYLSGTSGSTITLKSNTTVQIQSGGMVVVGTSNLTWGALTLNAGGTLNLNGYDLSAASVTSGSAGSTITDNSSGTGTSTLKFTGSTSTLGSTVIADGATRKVAITYNGSTTLTLGTNNTYSGPTTIQSGTLSAASLNYVTIGTWGIHTGSNLGAPTTAANGTIAIGSTTTAGQLTYTGSGETTDRVIDLAGTTGGATIDQSGTGLLKFSSPLTATGAGVKTLTLNVKTR